MPLGGKHKMLLNEWWSLGTTDPETLTGKENTMEKTTMRPFSLNSRPRMNHSSIRNGIFTQSITSDARKKSAASMTAMSTSIYFIML